jgi:WD40 repeat protein
MVIVRTDYLLQVSVQGQYWDSTETSNGRGGGQVGDFVARVFDTATYTELARVRHDGLVRSVAFSPDGTRLATASWDGTARLFDTATYTELARLDFDDGVRSAGSGS